MGGIMCCILVRIFFVVVDMLGFEEVVVIV